MIHVEISSSFKCFKLTFKMTLARYVLITYACVTFTRAQYGGSSSGSSPTSYGASSSSSPSSYSAASPSGGYGATSGSYGTNMQMNSDYGSGSSGSTGNSNYGASPAQSTYGGSIMSGGYGGSGYGSGSSGSYGSSPSGGGTGVGSSGSMGGSSYGASPAQSSYGAPSYQAMGSSGYGTSGSSYGSSGSSYGSSNNYYTAAPSPTNATTVAPGNTTCPSAAPIGCRNQALLDPTTGNVLFCLLVCDQPVTRASTTTTTASPGVTLSGVTAAVTTITTVAPGANPSPTPSPTPAPAPSPSPTPGNVPDPAVAALQANILACINAGMSPPAGCSFNGQGMMTPLTCPISCNTIVPGINPTCDPTAGILIERCICLRGPPPSGCSLQIASASPLTCAVLCPANFPGGGR